jgi:hypothetical protein
MNVRQHSCGRGQWPGPEASGFSPEGFLSVGASVEFSPAFVWQNPNPFAQAALKGNFSCGT